MELIIRPALVDDAAVLADAHVATWRSAYREILPASYLAALSVERSRERWEAIAVRPEAIVLVAVGDAGDPARVVGFASAGPARDEDVDAAQVGEITAIYVREESWGTGLGRRLFGEARERLRGRGHVEMILSVLERNDRARRFYERAGMQLDPAWSAHLRAGGIDHPIVRYRMSL